MRQKNIEKICLNSRISKFPPLLVEKLNASDNRFQTILQIKVRHIVS